MSVYNPALCPTCGQPLEYEDDVEQETWAHVEGFYACPQGHTFSEDEIEGDGYDSDDEYDE